MEVQLKLRKSNKCATLPTCNSLLRVPFLFWLIEGAGTKISKVLVLVFVFDAMVSIFLALIFGHALLFHYCKHEGIGLNTQLRTYCLWKICPHNAHMQRPFFLQTYLFLLRAVWAASESTEKCVQSTEISVQFGPARTKRTYIKQKPAFFFTSIRPSVKTVSAAGTTRSGRVDVLKPGVYSA